MLGRDMLMPEGRSQSAMEMMHHHMGEHEGDGQPSSPEASASAERGRGRFPVGRVFHF